MFTALAKHHFLTTFLANSYDEQYNSIKYKILKLLKFKILDLIEFNTVLLFRVQLPPPHQILKFI